MGQSVVLVIAFLMESFAAEFAYEGPKPLVNPHVGVQGGASVKSLAASLAFVRFLRCVNNFVTAQSRRLAEPFTTNLANEWARS